MDFWVELILGCANPDAPPSTPAAIGRRKSSGVVASVSRAPHRVQHLAMRTTRVVQGSQYPLGGFGYMFACLFVCLFVRDTPFVLWWTSPVHVRIHDPSSKKHVGYRGTRGTKTRRSKARVVFTIKPRKSCTRILIHSASLHSNPAIRSPILSSRDVRRCRS